MTSRRETLVGLFPPNTYTFFAAAAMFRQRSLAPHARSSANKYLVVRYHSVMMILQRYKLVGHWDVDAG